MGFTEILLLIFFVKLNQLLIFFTKFNYLLNNLTDFNHLSLLLNIIVKSLCACFIVPLINFCNSPIFSILSMASLASHNSSDLTHVAVYANLLENKCLYRQGQQGMYVQICVLESHGKESKMGEQKHYLL
jgi:hypothetical protein